MIHVSANAMQDLAVSQLIIMVIVNNAYSFIIYQQQIYKYTVESCVGSDFRIRTRPDPAKFNLNPIRSDPRNRITIKFTEQLRKFIKP